MKKAFVTGISGQDGSYLTDLLLEKDYEVHGLIRRSSVENLWRIQHLLDQDAIYNRRLFLHYGDMTDGLVLSEIVRDVQPDEIYNLAAMSQVRISYDIPANTAEITGLGFAKLLEAVKQNCPSAKLYQASSSEMFGKVQETPQNEKTPFYPRSPYGCAKAFAFYLGRAYREAYGMKIYSGILFNHECISINTPLIVKTNNFIRIVTVDELVSLKRNGTNVQQFESPDVEIWDGQSWTPIQGITATKRKDNNPEHKLLSVEARGGVVSCTSHHTMIRANTAEVRADSLQAGEEVLLAESMPKTQGWTSLTNEMAEFLGLMAADGYVPDSDRSTLQFTKNDESLRNRVAELWSRLFAGNARHAQGSSGFSDNLVGQLYLTGTGVGVTRWLREQLYSKDGFKRVPVLILNATLEIQAIFLDAYYAGDGLKAGKGDSVKTNSTLLAQGLFWLYSNQGRLVSVYLEQRGGRNYYQLNLSSAIPNGNKGQHLRKSPAEIRQIRPADIQDDEWVFDLATESGRFVAGVGRLVVHNSPRRGDNFLSKKVVKGAVAIKRGLQSKLYLGNLDAKRDWGSAQEYVEWIWRIVQHDTPDDFVIATGETHTVEEFVAETFGCLDLDWREYVVIDPSFLRPAEVDLLIGDYSKSKAILGFEPKVKFKELVKWMVETELCL